MRSGEFSSFSKAALFSLALILFAPAPGCQQPQAEVDLMHLSWEKDFELILEINNVPTRGQVSSEKELNALREQIGDLQDKKEELERRLESLSTVIYTDKLYDEMLREGTNDVSSTRASIEKKLEAVNEKLDELETALRRKTRK